MRSSEEKVGGVILETLVVEVVSLEEKVRYAVACELRYMVWQARVPGLGLTSTHILRV